jgi:hypothetical protein
MRLINLNGTTISGKYASKLYGIPDRDMEFA